MSKDDGMSPSVNACTGCTNLVGCVSVCGSIGRWQCSLLHFWKKTKMHIPWRYAKFNLVDMMSFRGSLVCELLLQNLVQTD